MPKKFSSEQIIFFVYIIYSVLINRFVLFVLIRYLLHLKCHKLMAWSQFLTPPPWGILKLLSHSRGKIFTAGPMYSPVIVFTFTTPTILSDEGRMSMFEQGDFFLLVNSLLSKVRWYLVQYLFDVHSIYVLIVKVEGIRLATFSRID